MAILKLDLTLLDTHSLDSFAIADTSVYPVGFAKVNPTIEITPPGFEMTSLVFNHSSVTVYNSATFGIPCHGEDCENIALPDGIYNIKYTLTPAYLYKLEKSFLRVDKLLAKLDGIQIRMGHMHCDADVMNADRALLDNVEFYISAAIAAANKCLPKFAMELYHKASDMLDHYKKCN